MLAGLRGLRLGARGGDVRRVRRCMCAWRARLQCRACHAAPSPVAHRSRESARNLIAVRTFIRRVDVRARSSTRRRRGETRRRTFVRRDCSRRDALLNVPRGLCSYTLGVGAWSFQLSMHHAPTSSATNVP